MNVRADQDPFRKMLALSGAVHALVFTSMLASCLGRLDRALPEVNDEFTNVVNLRESGPLPGAPAAPVPYVVGPPVNQRDQIPQPHAPLTKPPTPVTRQGVKTEGAEASSESVESRHTSSRTPRLGVVGPDGGSPFPFDQDFEYSYYVQQMLGRIQRHWQRITVRGSAVVIVRFTILKDGTVEDAELEQSSGSSILDRAALRAVILAAPMPTLPSSYSRERVRVHLRFSYSNM